MHLADELINVYDLSDLSYPSVGTATSSKYFRGYNSDFSYTDDKGTTTGGLTVNNKTSTLATSGRVAIYRLSTGSFYLADPKSQTLWRESNMVRVVLSATNTETISSINNPLYTTHIPRLRNSIVGIANVTTANKYAYPLLAGSRPSIPAATTLSITNGNVAITNGNVAVISFNEDTEPVYLTYGYGSRSGKYSLPYDTAFAELDADSEYKQYLNRVGYSLTSINDEKLDDIGLELDTNGNTQAKESLNLIYNKAYPVYSTSAGSNAYTWTAKTDNQFEIQFEKGAGDNIDGWDINFMKGPQVTGVTGEQSPGSYTYTHTSGTSVKIEFQLSANYTVSGVAKETVASGTHSDYYYYSTNNQGQNVTDDSYLEANISHTRNTDNEYSAKTYTVTINNIVGRGGIYKIYIEKCKELQPYISDKS